MNAKCRVHYDGTYADPDWFSRATFALKAKGREHQALLLEFGSRRKEARRLYNGSVERAFIVAAARYVDQKTFQAIMDEANAMAAQPVSA
jgi:hypothetical protein